MSCKRALLPVFLVLLAACARRPAPAVDRLAVLRFENLGADASTDWMGRAFSEIIASELAAAPRTYSIPSSRLHSLGHTLGPRPIAIPGISAEAPLAIAAGANHLVYGTYRVEGGRIYARMTIEDLETRRQRSFEAVAAPDPDVAAAATALARQVWPQAPSYSAHTAAAVEAFAKAVEAPGIPASEELVRRAIADDPDFGQAYLLLAELEAQQHHTAALTDTLQNASARGTALSQIDRAHLETIAAGINGDANGRRRAIDLLLRLTPNDPGVWRSAAEMAGARHEYAQAAGAYERALVVEPEDVASWNQLAYAAVFSGNLPAAMTALRRYQAMRPGDPNALDSMGDVNFIAGQFKQAEGFYLQAFHISPTFLNGGDQYKAAFARLMTGDVPGAGALFEKYPAAAPHRPEWLWLTGHRRQAYEMLAAETPALPTRDAQTIGYSELAIWALQLEDTAGAAEMARKAVDGVTPGTAGVAALARYLAVSPLSPSAWETRAEQFFPNPSAVGARDLALGYAHLLSLQFGPAAEALRRAYDGSATAPESGLATDLGWALIETGDDKAAAPLLRLNPVPSAGGPGPTLSLVFPQIFHARALLAQKQGKAEEARANQALFEKLSAR